MIVIVTIIPLRLWCGRVVAVRSRTFNLVDAGRHGARHVESDTIHNVAARGYLAGLGRYDRNGRGDRNILWTEIGVGGRRVESIFLRRSGRGLKCSGGLLSLELHARHFGRDIGIWGGALFDRVVQDEIIVGLAILIEPTKFFVLSVAKGEFKLLILLATPVVD